MHIIACTCSTVQRRMFCAQHSQWHVRNECSAHFPHVKNASTLTTLAFTFMQRFSFRDVGIFISNSFHRSKDLLYYRSFVLLPPDERTKQRLKLKQAMPSKQPQPQMKVLTHYSFNKSILSVIFDDDFLIALVPYCRRISILYVTIHPLYCCLHFKQFFETTNRLHSLLFEEKTAND